MGMDSKWAPLAVATVGLFLIVFVPEIAALIMVVMGIMLLISGWNMKDDGIK